MSRKTFHIKNFKNQKLKVLVINADFGNLEREKIFDETPSKSVLDKAFEFLWKEYGFDLTDPDHEEYTLEGIDSDGTVISSTNYITDKTGKIAKEGTVYAQDRDPSTMIPDSPLNTGESPNSRWSESQPLPGDPNYVPYALEEKPLSDPVTLTGNLSRPVNIEDIEQNSVQWQQYQELLRASFLAAGQIQNFEAIFGDSSVPSRSPDSPSTNPDLDRNLDDLTNNLLTVRGSRFDLSGFGRGDSRSSTPSVTDDGPPYGATYSGGQANLTEDADPASPPQAGNAGGPCREGFTPSVWSGPCPDGSPRKCIPTREEIQKWERLCEDSHEDPAEREAGKTFSCARAQMLKKLLENNGCPEELEVEGMRLSEESEHEVGDEPDEEKELIAEEEDASGAGEPAMQARAAVNTDGADSTTKEALKNLSEGDKNLNSGVGCTHRVDPVPEFAKADAEVLLEPKSRYNSFIVLGVDRPGNRISGYGGKGHTQCGAIDIVVGRHAGNPGPRSVTVSDGQKIYADPEFNVRSWPKPNKPLKDGYVCDAARIHISQKTDIDSNFKLTDGRVGSSVARSGIGIKADAVRVIGNEGIKLVTRSDKFNSQGGPITKIRGVDIIANNNQRALQPMVLGNNLTRCLTDLTEVIDMVVGTVESLLLDQIMLHTALASHIHINTGPAAFSGPSPNLIPLDITLATKNASKDVFSGVAQKWNLARSKLGYLERGGKMSIRSRYNNVN
jgi:hypothetical protein